jgi:MYXO-CTERM domain-containing protein
MLERLPIVFLSTATAFTLLTACSESNHTGGGMRGVFRSGTADYLEEGRSEKFYALEREDGSFVDLQFSGKPGIAPGTEIVVFGPWQDRGLRVDRFELASDVDGIGRQSQALMNPTPLSPPLKAGFVSLRTEYTKDMINARMAKPDFIKPVLEVSSYGIWTMEWDAIGPITIARDCGGSFFSNIGKNAEAAMKMAGIDTTQYNQFQFLLPSDFPCGWSGFGLDGHSPIRTDGKRGMYNPWSYVKNDGENVIVQEIGHNWGLAHVHFCPGAPTPSPNCTGYQEYGSPFTPMAKGNNVYLNAWERIQMNFLAGCNVVTAATSGMYEIGSLTTPCDGPQVLRVAADKAGTVQRYFYLEYRRPFGIEKTNGVLVHYTADIKNGGWTNCDYGGPDCPEDWIINPKGGTAAEAVLTAPYEWTTPEGVKIRIAATDETAKFELTFPTAGGAPPTCLDDRPWDNKGPVCAPGGGAGGAGGGGVGGAGGMGVGGGGGRATGGAAGSGGRGGAGGAVDGRDGGASGGAGGSGGGSTGGGPIAPDAGSIATGGGAGANGTSGAGGTVNPPTGPTGTPGGAGNDSGCSCRTGRSSPAPVSAFGWIVALFALRRRRTTA